MQQRRVARRRVIVPLVLAITTAVAAAATSVTGCGDDAPAPNDARAGDAPTDTPIV